MNRGNKGDAFNICWKFNSIVLLLFRQHDKIPLTSHRENGTDFSKISPIQTIPKAPCNDTDIVPNHDAKRPTMLAPIRQYKCKH